jgi:hypothetical protein
VDTVSINLRLPADLHAAVKEAATDETRSLNGQIIQMLREALTTRGKSARPPTPNGQ